MIPATIYKWWQGFFTPWRQGLGKMEIDGMLPVFVQPRADSSVGVKGE
jgi:hypothetical protein